MLYSLTLCSNRSIITTPKHKEPKMAKDKVTAKIDRDVYKKLQQVKLDQELQTITEAILYLIENQEK